MPDLTPQHRADLAAAEALPDRQRAYNTLAGPLTTAKPRVFLASAAEAMRRGWLDAAALHLECAGEPARAALAALRAGDVGEAERHILLALSSNEKGGNH